MPGRCPAPPLERPTPLGRLATAAMVLLLVAVLVVVCVVMGSPLPVAVDLGRVVTST